MKWFFLLYFLNICVDAPDPVEVKKVHQDYSDQETLVEIIVEKIIGFDKAIPDFDQNDTDDPTAKSGKLPLVFICNNFTNNENFTIIPSERKSFVFDTNLYSFLRVDCLVKPPDTRS